MLYTSSGLNKLLKQLNDECERIKSVEKTVFTFCAAISEKLEDARPEYDYASSQAKIKELNSKIRKIKHALNIFNSTTVVDGFDMTIDEMLVYIPQLTNQKNKLSGMINRPKKIRKEQDRYGSPKSYVEYEYVNYDIEEVTKDFNEVTELLSKAQLALDSVNNKALIELNI